MVIGKVRGFLYLINGTIDAVNALGVTVCNYCVVRTGISTIGDTLLYACHLEVHEEDLVKKKSLPCRMIHRLLI